MKIICVIPARGGSKGIPRKNLRMVAGASLVGRAIFHAREFARLFPDGEVSVVLDTDSEEIAAEGKRWGASVPFLRDEALAGDTTATVDSLVALLRRLSNAGSDYDVVILLQPTSPLRDVDEITRCWERFAAASGERAVTTAMEVAASKLRSRSGEPLGLPGAAVSLRRQDAEHVYALTGSVYVIPVRDLLAGRGILVPERTELVTSAVTAWVDVDGPADLQVANALSGLLEERECMLGSMVIGAGSRCFVIAEAGVNHNGDEAVALRMIEEAAAAGADAVKFQTFDPDLLVSDQAPKAEYQKAATGGGKNQKEMLAGLMLPRTTYARLASRAAELGIVFMSTPFDEASADLLEEIDCPAFKLGSGEVTNHPFLAHVASKGRPVILSTGMSTLAEVAEAVHTIRSSGDPPLVLLHCVTEYPADPVECNLLAMHAMRSLFRVPVGWSDHTPGSTVSLAAVALGAAVIEKHFTLSREMEGPDHAASSEPAELADLIRAVRDVEVSRGDGTKAPSKSELRNLHVVRRSLHVTRDLPRGHVLSRRDIVALRPAGGIDPSATQEVIGRALRSNLQMGAMLTHEHLA